MALTRALAWFGKQVVAFNARAAAAPLTSVRCLHATAAIAQARPSALDESAVADAMQSLPSWKLEDGGLAMRKTFQFADFSAAWGFMSRSALVAEQLDHHPEWDNVYNTVNVRLQTHDAGPDGALTELDVRMATSMDAFAA